MQNGKVISIGMIHFYLMKDIVSLTKRYGLVAQWVEIPTAM